MTEPEHLITTAEVAIILGVSKRTVVRKADQHELPVVAKAPGIRGAYLFDRDAIEGSTEEQEPETEPVQS